MQKSQQEGAVGGRWDADYFLFGHNNVIVAVLQYLWKIQFLL